jgi:hypothetical protein
MQKSEDVVTPSSFDQKLVESLTDEILNLEALTHLLPFRPFDDKAIEFLKELGNLIIRDKRSQSLPDLISFAFWCSNSNVFKMKESIDHSKFLMGRGIVFHIAPANVPINFAFSLATGILTGNINIVRVPSKKFTQVDVVSDSINVLLRRPSNHIWRDRIHLLRYGHDGVVTDALSLICDVRLIWGGDAAVNEIRKSPLKPKSYDLVFADRYSFCVINSDSYLASTDQTGLARNFYNDVYLFDQNACTSPHLIIWVGDKIANRLARETFWSHLSRITENKYQMTSMQSVRKISAAYLVAAKFQGSSMNKTSLNSISRVLLEKPPITVEDLRSSSGFFIECDMTSLDSIGSIITRSFQTMSYFGFERKELSNFLNQSCSFGIDRIVPIGGTLDFSLLWDGYNLVSMLSREMNLSATME